MITLLATRIGRAAALGLVLVSIGTSALAAAPQGGIEDALSSLYAAVKAGDEAKTVKAATAVVAFGEPAVALIGASIADKSPQEIVWALRCVREIGVPQGKDIAAAVCTHANPAVRAEAVWTAHATGHEASLPILWRASSDPDDNVRRRAYDGIVACGSQAPEALDVAVKGVVDSDTWVMLAAFQILNDQPVAAEDSREKDKVVVAVGKLLPQLDERNAAATIDLIVRRGGIKSAPIIEKALDSRKPFVVVAAVAGVGTLRLSTLLPRVHAIAKGSDLEPAKAAIEAIAKINDSKSLSFLVDLLESSREAQRTDALAVALRTMTGRLYGTDVELWRKYLSSR